MYIAPVTQSLRNSSENSLYFGLKLRKKGGKWPMAIEEAFFNSTVLQQMAAGDKDVVGRLVSKKAGRNDIRHCKGTILYKLLISMPKSNSKWANLADNFHLYKRAKLTKNYHSYAGLLDSFNDTHYAYLKSQLG